MCRVPFVFTQRPQQCIASHQRPQPFGRLARGTDRPVHLAHGHQNVNISQAVERLFGLSRIAPLRLDRVRIALESEAVQGCRELLA